MKGIIFLLIITTSDSIPKVPEKIRKFAEFLEREGDYYRAITEYKRYIYYVKDEKIRDSFYLKIADLNLRMNLLKEVKKVLSRIKNKKNKKFFLIKGFYYIKLKALDSARRYFEFSDTLSAWTYLLERDYRKFRQITGIKINMGFHPNPLLSSLFSLLLPGSGKIYSGRIWDGFSSFIMNISSFLIFYHYYKKNPRSFGTYISGFSFGLFYLSNIYGSYISALEKRTKVEEQIIFMISTDLGIIKKFRKWLN